MQIYGRFEGFSLNSALVGHILTLFVAPLFGKKCVHWIWKFAREKK